MRKKIVYLFSFFLAVFAIKAQPGFKFAHVSDTHIGTNTGLDDLRRTVQDINTQPEIKFVIITGDITDFGSDTELQHAKQMLDSLQKPWYIVPGNHDAGWSESGTNSFTRVFGSETFAFSYGGYCFLGTACGPSLRMGPGQIPHEQIMWLDSALHSLPDSGMPVIFVNHYPMDSAMTNWYQVMDLLKQHNTQAILCGHWHSNRLLNCEGIPEIVGRSNLRANKEEGGYNIVTIEDGKISYRERHPGKTLEKVWAVAILQKHDFTKDTTNYMRPSYAINNSYPFVRVNWKYQDESDIRCGISLAKDLLITANTKGEIYALRQSDGKSVWHFQTRGKIFATPAVEGDVVVVASTDSALYCLNARSGELCWRSLLSSSIVASPLIHDGIIYIGSSNGHFKAIRLKDGKMLWDFGGVHGFVESRPVFYNNHLFFASWGNELYALNSESGKLDWKWSNGMPNRMFSAAGCEPVIVKNRLFVATPDRFMTVLDALNGKEIWRKHWDSAWARQSIGISEDSSLVYIKTMQGKLEGIPVSTSVPEISWHSELNLGYELDPAIIREKKGVVYVPSDNGIVSAISRATGKLLWQYKIAHSPINTILATENGRIYVSSADGRIYCLVANSK